MTVVVPSDENGALLAAAKASGSESPPAELAASPAAAARVVPQQSRLVAGVLAVVLACGATGIGVACNAAFGMPTRSILHRATVLEEVETVLTDSDLGSEEPLACKTAQKDDACFKSVVWAMTKGIKDHPEWYEGLTQKSSFTDFQTQCALSPEDTHCLQKPCPEAPGCETAAKDSACGKAAIWDMTEGFAQHKSWYPGLSADSTYEDFQNHINDWNKTLCPRPACSHQPFEMQTLFCWMVILPEGYELGLANAQLEQKAGIFACDGYAVVSSQSLDIGVPTLLIGSTKVSGWSGDGTSPNAPVFVDAWRAIQADGKYQEHDWIIKSDPDNVLMPDRLRMHLLPGMQPANPYAPPYESSPNVGQYVTNCDKMASWGKGWGDGWPMMYGSLEIISVQAINLYYANEDACKGSIPWQGMGEDAFMGLCLRQLQVGELFMKQADGTCAGGSCDDPTFSSYHPYKDPTSWFDCWNRAQR